MSTHRKAKYQQLFFLAVAELVLPYWGTTRTLLKRLDKMLGGNYTKMLRAV